MTRDTLTVTDNRTGTSYELPITDGTIKATDLRQISTGADDFGLMTYDPAFMNTAACRSAVTYIDGDRGILRYRGYPIEELAERASFLEVAYLLTEGELPNRDELDAWTNDVRYHTYVHTNVIKFLEGFRYDAHPMGMLLGAMGALSTFYPDAKNIHDPMSRYIQRVRLVSKMPTIAAFLFRHSRGLPYEFPRNDLDYIGNYVNMMFSIGGRHDPNPVLQRALEKYYGIARERRFTSDAAHELRTPLTGIVTNLQVARITRGPDAEEGLRNAAEGAARLRHTLEQLLTLSQVEGPFAWDDGGAARAGEVARQAVRDSGAARGRIMVVGDGEDVALAVPQSLAVIAVRNLLDNAVRHSPDASPVSLEVRVGANEVRYCVADRGPGMSEEEIRLAAGRFWRRGPGPGSGLGLSIVAAIAERFSGSFELARREGSGLRATLALPRAGE